MSSWHNLMSLWNNRCLCGIPNVFMVACHVALGWTFRFSNGVLIAHNI